MHAVTAIHPVATTRKFEITCSSCNLRELCLPAGLCDEDLERIENVVYARRRVRRGEALFKAGGGFAAMREDEALTFGIATLYVGRKPE